MEETQRHITGMSYKYEELHSRPSITPGSEIPENLLHFSHSFGYDSRRRGNLQLLDDNTLLFIAGNLLVLLDVSTKEHRYLRSLGGGGIGSIKAHPSKEYFAVAEKGNQPNIIVYEYPSLRPFCILRGGTEQEYSVVEFNQDGSLLASVGSAPDYMMTLWDWRKEKVMLSCKANSQDVYRVSFSLYNPGVLTSSGSGHINFWKMTSTLTTLKLQAVMGRFGKTEATDIEGYVELPQGEVVSGSNWGNMLVWDGNHIKIEISRKGGQNCHAGVVQPFALEDGQLMTIGSDGAVRGWDFEKIDSAGTKSCNSKFELEPMNEMMVGRNVCLSSVVRSSLPEIYFAQDSNGAIWKLDLSFFDTTPDPECLFSFHAGAIQGLDVSWKSHLMATTAPDCSVKVFDFLAKRELTTYRFNRGGTSLSWAPAKVNQSGSLLVTGFEDGVVRLLELYDPKKLHVVTGRSPKEEAKLHLKQAFKPHHAAVTAVAYEQKGEILATGSSDCTVFFFTVGEKYNPVGFVRVPGPVQALEWSPHSHGESRLLVLCQSGHVVELHSPDPETQRTDNTFQLPDPLSRSFRFRSIKSRIKRDEEIAKRQAIKEKQKTEREERLKVSKQLEVELEEEGKEEEEEEEEQEEEEEEEALPPIYIPNPPSPLYCGFYSQPGQFWLSMGGFDAGFLYHCKFSENQDEDPDQRQDEPFDFLPVHNTDDDPIRSITFSSNRQLLFCGMHSGFIRVYPLQPGDHCLTSMQAYWALSVHDNQYGHLRHIRCSHDNHFVLTAGDDSNIFSFSLIPPEELEKGLQRVQVPSPRVGLENEALAQDIEDPAAYSIETAKQKLEEDRLRREANMKIAAKRQKIAELLEKYKKMLIENQKLPEHVRLTPEELELHPCFREQAERAMAQRVREVRKQMAWKEERCSIALRKMQNWFKDCPEANVITVVAICTDHRISTYGLPAFAELSSQLGHGSRPSRPDEEGSAAPESRTYRAGSAKNSRIMEEDEVLHPPAHSAGIKSTTEIPGLQKAAEKVEQARAKFERRKQQETHLNAGKLSEEDLQHMEAEDYEVPKHLWVNAEEKTAELKGLEENIRKKKTEMNTRIVALRDSKVRLVSQLQAQTQQVQKIHQRLPEHFHRPPPILPKILPEETPEKKLQYSRATLKRYQRLREQRFQTMEQEEQEGVTSILEQLDKEMEEERASSGSIATRGEEEETAAEGSDEELSELEQELRREEEIRLVYEQDSLLQQMEGSVSQFDAELMLLRHQKLRLDWQLKMADLHQLTLFQEILILQEFKREEEIQEEILEELSISINDSKLDECNERLKLKQENIAKLQEREKSLISTFRASLGKENKFEKFLTKVFKKKIQRVKKTEQTVNKEEDEDSIDDPDEVDDWHDDDDDDDDDEDDDSSIVCDGSVCPPGCEPELFEKTLQLRECRLELQEQLAEEKKSSKALEGESYSLAQKEQLLMGLWEQAESNLELINRKKHERMNAIQVVVPLRLNQIKFFSDGSLPSDLSQALVVDTKELNRLHERSKQLQAETSQLRDQCCEAHKQHVRLLKDREDNEKLMQEKLTKEAHEKLMEDKRQQEAANAKRIKQLDAEEEAAEQNLMEVTKRNTELMLAVINLMNENKDLDDQLNARHRHMIRREFLKNKRCEDQEDIWRLKELVKTQSQQAEALRTEISFLSSGRPTGLVTPKTGHVRPPRQGPVSTPTGNPQTGRPTRKAGNALRPRKAQRAPLSSAKGGTQTDLLIRRAGHVLPPRSASLGPLTSATGRTQTLLTRTAGHALPPSQAPLPPIQPLQNPAGRTLNQGAGHP